MTDGIYRIAVAGAASLLGKELADELQDSALAASQFVLLDDEAEAAGQLTAVGEEPSIVRELSESSFERMDFVFFAGEAASTLEYWGHAKSAGSSIVDMTYALEDQPGVPVRAPWVLDCLRRKAGVLPGLTTTAVVSAHPVAAMLALVAARLQANLEVVELVATVFEPASEQGRPAMDELHQQTISLLSFKDLPREHYDSQVAFNLLPSLGDAAKVPLIDAEARIQRHYRQIDVQLRDDHAIPLPALSLQLIQAPVFHGYALSVFVRTGRETNAEELEALLSGDGVDVVADDSEPPSNLSAAGQEDVMVRVRAAREGHAGRSFWLWLAADNLKLAALNGISCANELKRLRPKGKVQ
jgi:aspartate-semialdehyde dehydrogenase